MSITCNLKGGIGNQLFQIATTYSLAKRFDVSWCILDGQFDGAGQGNHPLRYYTTIYQKVPRYHIHTPTTIHERQWTFYDVGPDVKAFLDTGHTIMLDGYFQSDRHFYGYDKEVKELFTPPEGIKGWLKHNTDTYSSYPELFEDHDACFIGVRRGDYIEKAYFHNPCDYSYYQTAMAKFPPGQRFYIASDDIAWCKEYFQGPQFTFFNIDNDLIQLYIAALFKNYIIANSTFHWWASFLSVYEHLRIYAPDKWSFGPHVKWDEYSTIYRDTMIVLER
jgi:Glycosyl transferase family 11